MLKKSAQKILMNAVKVQQKRREKEACYEGYDRDGRRCKSQSESYQMLTTSAYNGRGIAISVLEEPGSKKLAWDEKITDGPDRVLLELPVFRPADILSSSQTSSCQQSYEQEYYSSNEHLRTIGDGIQDRLQAIIDEYGDKIRECKMRVDGMAMATQWVISILCSPRFLATRSANCDRRTGKPTSRSRWR